MTAHTLTINGEKVTVTQEGVLLAAADVRPNVRPPRHGVLIGSVLWAPKDLLRAVIGDDDLGNIDSPRAMTYVACGQHITAPIMRSGELVPFIARPI